MGASGTSPLCFQAAVERPLNAVFQAPDGRWEGHDYRVEVVTERQGLDAFDVVMDFRDLEATLDELLAPLQHRLLSDQGLSGPEALASHLRSALAPRMPEGVRLAEIALTDGHGHRLALKS